MEVLANELTKTGTFESLCKYNAKNLKIEKDEEELLKRFEKNKTDEWDILTMIVKEKRDSERHATQMEDKLAIAQDNIIVSVTFPEIWTLNVKSIF